MRLFLKSFIYAMNGIRWSIEQRNMKIHLVCAVLAVSGGILLDISFIEWCVVLMAIGLVISFEIVNTAMELLVDFIEPNHHVIAGKIKDLAAGAVLFASFIAFICGVLIFGKYVLVYF